jgi:hypothetical protein
LFRNGTPALGLSFPSAIWALGRIIWLRTGHQRMDLLGAARQRRCGKYGGGEGRLKEKNQSVGGNMKIEVHTRVYEKAQTGNQGARMKCEAPRVAFNTENLP